MFDKISQRHLQVGAKSWRPFADDDPKRRGGITADRGVFVCNIHHHHPHRPQQPAPAPAPIQKLPPPPSEPSAHKQAPVDPPFEQTPGVHFASPHHSVPASAHSHHSGLAPSHISAGVQSVKSGYTGHDLASHHLTGQDQHQSPPLEDIPSTAELDAAVTEGILMRTREDIEEQERALAELQKAQELLALRETEIRTKEEAFQRMLEVERLRIEEDARLAQEAADQAASEAALQAEAEQREKTEQIERARLEHEREQEERQREMQRQMEERQREIEDRQREDEERQREMEERQREVQERQREIEEKEQAMMIQLENERQRLAQEAKLALEENIREQRRLEEEARFEQEMAKIRAEDQARAEREEQIAAEQRAKEDAKRAIYNRIHERENALRSAVFELPRQWNWPIAPISPLPIRELHPISFAQAYSSPSMYPYSLPPSPTMPHSPVFVPPEVKHAAQAQRRKNDTERKRREEEQQLKTAQLESELKAVQDKLAAETEEAERALLEHKARIDELDHRNQAAEQIPPKVRQEAEMKLGRERLLEEPHAVVALRQKLEAQIREKEEILMERRRQQVARLQAKQAATRQSASSQSDQSDEEELAARRRGAEEATYFMTKQALSRPLRAPKLSNSQSLSKRAMSPGRQRRASYTATPPLLNNLSRMASSPSSEFLVFSFDKVPGYAHDVVDVVESSYILNVEQAPALDFLCDTEQGKSLAKHGNRRAVQALVKVAQELPADAIIKLTTNNPVAIDSHRINFSARGVAVTLKSPSSNQIVHHTGTSSMCQAGRSRKDSINSIYANITASAPVRALPTPAMSMKSEPFDNSSLKAASPPTQFNRLRFASNLVSQHLPQTPLVRVVPPSTSSKSSSPNVQADVPLAVSSSPFQRTLNSPPQPKLPDPPNFTQPKPVSPPRQGRPSREMIRPSAESVSRSGVILSSRQENGAALNGEREPTEDPAVRSAKALSGRNMTGHSPVAKPIHMQESATSLATRTSKKSTEAQSLTPRDSQSASAPVTIQMSSPRDLPASHQDFSPPQCDVAPLPKPLRQPVDPPRSILRKSSPGGTRSVRVPRADESPPARQSEPDTPHRGRSPPTSPVAYKRYSATQVPLPMTPHQSRRLWVPETPRQVPLPESPDRKQSVHFEDVWVGDTWESQSPAMGNLIAPLTPKVVTFDTGRQKNCSKHVSPLIDMDDDEFDMYPRARGSPQGPKPVAWEEFDLFMRGL